MAANVAMRTYLTTHMSVATNEEANAIIAEGLETFEDFLDFDDDSIQDLCSMLRKPGGTIQVGNNQVPNPGHRIRNTTCMRLKLAVYAAKYYTTVSRPVNQITLAWNIIKQFKNLRNIVDDYPTPEDLLKPSKTLSVIRWIEHFEDQMKNRLGIDDIPLYSVIRDNENPTPVEALIQGGPPYGPSYTNYFDEMTDCVTLQGATYDQNNARVYNYLRECLGGTVHQTHLRPFARRHDGRGAWKAFVLANLGTNKWDDEIAKAETMTMTVTRKGRSARNTLKKHINNHRVAQNMLERAAQHTAYDPPNQHLRVKRLLSSLKTSNGSVLAAITTIKADRAADGMTNNFEVAADFLLQAIGSESEPSGNKTHNISQVETENAGGNKKKKGKGKKKITKGPETGVEVRYYSRDSFGDLSEAQIDELKSIRAQNKKKDKSGGNNKQYEAKISALETTVTELKDLLASTAQNISALTTAANQQSNRNNSALTRINQNN